jgi:hypothetical protein
MPRSSFATAYTLHTVLSERRALQKEPKLLEGAARMLRRDDRLAVLAAGALGAHDALHGVIDAELPQVLGVRDLHEERIPPRLLFVAQQPRTKPVPVGRDGRQLEEHLLVGGGLGLPLRPLPLEVLAVVVDEVVRALGDDAGEPLLETLLPLEGVLGRLRRWDEREWCGGAGRAHRRWVVCGWHHFHFLRAHGRSCQWRRIGGGDQEQCFVLVKGRRSRHLGR